jgi:hypothetical protein
MAGAADIFVCIQGTEALVERRGPKPMPSAIADEGWKRSLLYENERGVGRGGRTVILAIIVITLMVVVLFQ